MTHTEWCVRPKYTTRIPGHDGLHECVGEERTVTIRQYHDDYAAARIAPARAPDGTLAVRIIMKDDGREMEEHLTADMARRIAAQLHAATDPRWPADTLMGATCRGWPPLVCQLVGIKMFRVFPSPQRRRGRAFCQRPRVPGRLRPRLLQRV